VEKNGAEFFEVLCGLAKLGAIAVPVNWRLTAQEMAHIVADAGARAVVVGEEFFGHLDAIVDELGDVHTVVAIGEHG
ncbi:AMP-binding protein, partial [Mycolicibacterium elephantis]